MRYRGLAIPVPNRTLKTVIKNANAEDEWNPIFGDAAAPDMAMVLPSVGGLAYSVMFAKAESVPPPMRSISNPQKSGVNMKAAAFRCCHARFLPLTRLSAVLTIKYGPE